jgi:hypothetical protein
MAPKVFVSHASEDKDRFVLDFARRLREKGVDAWLDKWEMLPGDSLVDKIFQEGIKDASAVIVVLSPFSENKPWVREELNAAFVKRINSGSKLIPVIIEDCIIPEALSNTLWEKITDLENYDASLDRILASIFGINDKPTIGSPPDYTSTLTHSIGDLNKSDSLVLCLCCEEALRCGDTLINPYDVFFKNDPSPLPTSEIEDSLEILEKSGHIKLTRALGSKFIALNITTFGLDHYLRATLPDYDKKIISTISAIINESIDNNIAIAQHLNESQVIVDHIIDLLESNNHLKQSKMMGGLFF